MRYLKGEGLIVEVNKSRSKTEGLLHLECIT